MPIQEHNFWATTVDSPAVAVSPELPDSVDVAVVGAGFCGLSAARALSPRNRMIYDSKHFLYYYRLTPDNRMLFGGRAAFFPETKQTIRRSAEILRRDMAQVFPQLRSTKIEHAWG